MLLLIEYIFKQGCNDKEGGPRMVHPLCVFLTYSYDGIKD